MSLEELSLEHRSKAFLFVPLFSILLEYHWRIHANVITKRMEGNPFPFTNVCITKKLKQNMAHKLNL